MVTRTVIRINSSEVEQWAVIADAADNNDAAAIQKTANKQSETSKNTTSPAAALDRDRKKRKRPLPLWRDTTNDQATMNRRRRQKNPVVIDLRDVPPRPPIPKSVGRVKEGASKYTGVSFNKRSNRWQAQIHLDGKYRLIGRYDDEEEAGADYSRALFKYKGGVGRFSTIDLSDVPPQPPVPKRSKRVKGGTSKYKGVSFNKIYNKWIAQIMFEGKQHAIGLYDNEEEAAVDYARAVFKYKRGSGGQDHRDSFVIDLSNVPPQPTIPKNSCNIKEGASKYTGVTFNKHSNSWHAQIMIEGKNRFIGLYDSEEEAAVDYARALFKYKGGERDSYVIDLGDVPPQPPIPKSSGRVKEGASRYTGVCFNKQSNKWRATIVVKGKQRHVGYYDNEEEAAVDYARALFKYTADGAEGKATNLLR